MTKCVDCGYLGDKYSFPLPNDKIFTEKDNGMIKHYYCCCGDSNWYDKDVTNEDIRECDCFEEI